MDGLKKFFQAELPVINRVLKEELENLNPLVKDVAEHVLMAGGKRMRPMLTLLVARGLGCSDRDIYPLACSLEFLHSATLIHDDILDNAELRRGQDAAHVIFGTRSSILAGDALLALANMIVARYGLPAMNFCVAEAILRTASGEVEEIANLRNPEMDKARYLDIVKGKTAFLIQAACSCGAMVAGADRYLEEQATCLGFNLGIAFQLVDDALDYASESELMGKPNGSDLMEGKITLPLILYLKTLSSSRKQSLLDKIASNKMNQEEVSQVIRNIQQAGLDGKVREEAELYLHKARKCLQVFPDCLEKTLLQEMLELVKARKF
ncbi:MAG: polyprenyl synthetase family protein [Desulfonatronovibrionaceae bacterium]